MVFLVFICKFEHRNLLPIGFVVFSYHRTFQEYQPWKGAQGIAHRQEKLVWSTLLISINQHSI